MKELILKYNLKQQFSAYTGEPYNTWFRSDLLFFIERYVMREGKLVDEFRIRPNTNDISKIGHINFSKHYYKNFEDAVENLIKM